MNLELHFWKEYLRISVGLKVTAGIVLLIDLAEKLSNKPAMTLPDMKKIAFMSRSKTAAIG